MTDDTADAFSYMVKALSMAQHKYIAFYGQQIYGEYDKFPRDLPDGCYIKNRFSWYIILEGALTPINLSDIPPEVRLNCLLLGINI